MKIKPWHDYTHKWKLLPIQVTSCIFWEEPASPRLRIINTEKKTRFELKRELVSCPVREFGRDYRENLKRTRRM